MLSTGDNQGTRFVALKVSDDFNPLFGGDAFVGTGTKIDEWFGGLPRGSLTLIQGPHGGGKTTLLATIANTLSLNTRVFFLTPDPTAIRFVNSSESLLFTSPSTLSEASGSLARLACDDVLIVDDAFSFFSNDLSLGANARLWGTYLKNLNARRITSVLADQAAPRAVGYMASLTLQLEKLATAADPYQGFALEVTATKSRTQSTALPKSMWLCPQ